MHAAPMMPVCSCNRHMPTRRNRTYTAMLSTDNGTLLVSRLATWRNTMRSWSAAAGDSAHPTGDFVLLLACMPAEPPSATPFPANEHSTSRIPSRCLCEAWHQRHGCCAKRKELVRRGRCAGGGKPWHRYSACRLGGVQAMTSVLMQEVAGRQ